MDHAKYIPVLFYLILHSVPLPPLLILFGSKKIHSICFPDWLVLVTCRVGTDFKYYFHAFWFFNSLCIPFHITMEPNVLNRNRKAAKLQLKSISGPGLIFCYNLFHSISKIYIICTHSHAMVFWLPLSQMSPQCICFSIPNPFLIEFSEEIKFWISTLSIFSNPSSADLHWGQIIIFSITVNLCSYLTFRNYGFNTKDQKIFLPLLFLASAYTLNLKEYISKKLAVPMSQNLLLLAL